MALTIDFAQYDHLLNNLANKIIEEGLNTPKYLEELLLKNDERATKLFNFRKYFLDKSEEEKIQGYLAIGFYSNKPREDRLAYFALEFDLEASIRRKRLFEACTPYDSNQKLFVAAPDLSDFIRIKGSKKGKAENELIDYKAFKQIYTSEVISFKDSYTTLSPYLNSRIPEWCNSNFPESPLFVRANSNIASNKRLPQWLTEELQIDPHNINWNLFTFNDKVFLPFEYKLLPIEEITEENRMEYWEYHVRGIRALQVSTSHKAFYRSFLLEELSDRYCDDKTLIGRCIHFDCKNFDDKKLDEQILDHLDLAINVYENENREVRLKETLRKGKITDADFRTHILRIDRVPFRAMPVFCFLFFQSSVAVKHYLKSILATY